MSTLSSHRLGNYTVGGVIISSIRRRDAINEFFRLVSSGSGGYVTLTSAHGVVESQSDDRLRRIINEARMTLADGLPILWAGKLKGAAVERFTGSEFFDTVMRDPKSTRLRHYFYGGQQQSTSRVVAGAIKLLGQHAVAGWHCPPFRAAGVLEDKSVIADIAATSPDVIWVGLSTPKQEYWMANHAANCPNSLLVGIGAAFDFFAGVKPRAPKFVQQCGFEWLYRLGTDPRRLWPRYRKVVPEMLKILLAEMRA